jgi:hypothetical protein
MHNINKPQIKTSFSKHLAQKKLAREAAGADKLAQMLTAANSG